MPFTSLRPRSWALNAEGRPLIPHQAGGLGRRAGGLGKLGWAVGGVELGKGEVKRGTKGKGASLKSPSGGVEGGRARGGEENQAQK